MKGFILAAGFGTRLQPITDEIPKPLIPIWGVPAICYSLMLLKEAGINEVVINIHYKHDMIIEYFEAHNNFGFDVHFSFEKEILGTGGGIKKCETILKDSSFIVLNSDVITDIKLEPLIQQYTDSDFTAIPILVSPQTETAPVTITDELIIDFKNTLKTEKPGTLDYSGMALLKKSVFPYLEKGFSSIVYTAYTSLIQKSRLPYYIHTGFWADIGTIENYKRINTEKLNADSKIFIRLKKILGITSDYKKFLSFINKFNI